MLIGWGTGVAVGNAIDVVVDSGVEVKVNVDETVTTVGVGRGVACDMQLINKLDNVISNKVFFMQCIRGEK